MNFLSLFSGIGGIDLGLERAGMRCVGQVEIDEKCCVLLSGHWPGVRRFGDIRQFMEWPSESIDLVAGGDPCPKHSRARSNGNAVHPDLSGYFLAVVGRFLPRWVVRENVPAPTVAHFSAALDALGYGSVVVRLDAAKVTGQSRQRDFTVARYQATADDIAGTLFADCEDGAGAYTTRLGQGQVTPALTTHRTRYDSRDCYVFNASDGLRILESGEREALAGFPADWTSGFHHATRARMCGNAVVPQIAEWIGQRILAASSPASPAPRKAESL